MVFSTCKVRLLTLLFLLFFALFCMKTATTAVPIGFFPTYTIKTNKMAKVFAKNIKNTITLLRAAKPLFHPVQTLCNLLHRAGETQPDVIIAAEWQTGNKCHICLFQKSLRKIHTPADFRPTDSPAVMSRYVRKTVKCTRSCCTCHTVHII